MFRHEHVPEFPHALEDTLGEGGARLEAVLAEAGIGQDLLDAARAVRLVEEDGFGSGEAQFGAPAPQLSVPRRLDAGFLSYEREDVLLEPLHYLPLLERKTGALDQAAPLAGWELPEAFLALRRLLETRLGKAGRREWVQVLRLLEVFRPEEVEAGVEEALRLGAIGFDAVKHLVLCRVERRPPRLDLEVYPYL